MGQKISPWVVVVVIAVALVIIGAVYMRGAGSGNADKEKMILDSIAFQSGQGSTGKAMPAKAPAVKK